MAISRDEAAQLSARVYALVRACPPGRVTTYGALGAVVGFPRGARTVGWIMNETAGHQGVPAQRVVSIRRDRPLAFVSNGDIGVHDQLRAIAPLLP